MQNLGVILRLMKQVAPGLDVKATAEEVRERIDEELDYELEAQNQRSLARIFRGHPFIVVPDVVTSLVAREGDRHGVRARPRLRGDEAHGPGDARPDRRDRLPLLLRAACTATASSPATRTPATSCCSTTAASRSSTSACSRCMPKELIELELECQRAGHEGDAERLHEIWSETGFIPHPERFRPDKLLDQFRDATWWYVLDEDDRADARDRHAGDDRHVATRARSTSARCATRRCPPTTCSAAGWRC